MNSKCALPRAIHAELTTKVPYLDVQYLNPSVLDQGLVAGPKDPDPDY